MKEAYFRNKIVWFTFLFSLLVVWVHSNNAVLYLGENETAYEIERMERFLGDGIAQIAVPGFFMISSYLFFRGFTLGRWKEKWMSRIRSILVPYIAWNFVYYVGYVVGSRIPVLTDIIGKGTVPVSLAAVVDGILHYTYNYVFWYLYQLILLIVLAPVIYLAVKKTWSGALWLGVILLVIYGGGELPVLNLDALFYYSAAAFIAVHGKWLAEGDDSRKRLTAGVILAALAFLLKETGLPGESKGELVFTIVIFRWAIPAALWLMVPGGWLPEAKDFMKNNFFLYAVHFAVVRLINKTGELLLPPVPAIPMILFLIMPVLAVAASSMLCQGLKRICPSAWRLLNGGR